MNGRKLPSHLENPIDNIFIKLSDKIIPFLTIFNITPNMITLLSFFFGLYSLWLIKQKDYTKATIYYLISYYFDVLDGYFARKTKQTSKYGDILDHYSDVIVNGLLVYIFIKNYYNKENYKLIILIMLTILTSIYIGCQEKYNTNDKANDTIKFTKMLCNTNYFSLENTRLFGCGTSALYYAYLIYTL
jgi:phosphatidylglycerophosphate synthase